MAAGILVRGVGVVIPAEQAEHVTTFGLREPGRMRCAEREVALTGCGKLVEGLIVGAVQPHDLASMDRALAREREQARLLLAPAGQGAGPFGGPAQVADFLTTFDQSAVDLAREGWRYLAGGD